MNDNVRRNLEPHRRKVPNGLNAACNHLVCDRLGAFTGRRDDAQMNAHPFRQISQFVQGKDHLPVNPLADLLWIGIERRYNPQAEVRKAFVPQQGRAEIADAGQERVLHVVPAKECLDCGNQLWNDIACFGPADYPGVLQVLPHLDRHKVQVAPDYAAGYCIDSLILKLTQVMMVLGQPMEARLWDSHWATLYGAASR